MLAPVVALLLASVRPDAIPSVDVAGRPAIDRGARSAVSFPFRIPGCFPSGSAMGTRGEKVTVVRASTKTCPIAAGEKICQANEACVTELGLLSETARTQLHPSPSAPAGGTVTFTATGTHQFWVVGSGSQQLSASGTLVATGLPCTATAAAPCSFNVTTLGATPTGTLAAVSGSLTRAQIEAGAYRSSFISSGTRPGDLIYAANPLATPAPARWCIDVTGTPQNGRAWAAQSGSLAAWGSGTNWSATESGDTSLTPFTDGFFYFDVVNTSNVDSVPRVSMTGWVDGSTKRFQALLDGTDVASARLSVDGALVTLANYGTGTAGPPRTNLLIGSRSSAREFGGYIRDLKVWIGNCR